MGESYRKKALHLLAVDMVRDPAVRIVLFNLARNYGANRLCPPA